MPNNINKILFLDHQGVMYTKKHHKPGTLDNFNPKNIEALNSILILEPTLQIVISSDWKRWVTLEEMQIFYKNQGILRAPIDYTPWRPNYKNYAGGRINEINEWLSTHIHSKWVAVDDLDLSDLGSKFIHVTRPDQGLTQENIITKLLQNLK